MGGTTQVGYGPLWRIDGPPPQAPQYTLLNASRVVADVDAGGVERWVNGVQVYAYPTDDAEVHDACVLGDDRVKAEGGSVPLPEFGAMTVYLGETCSTHGIYGAGLSNEEAQRRFVARAQAVFGAIESAAVEREFMAGDVLGLNPHLADGNGSFPWGVGVTNVVNGLALLENSIANSGRRGMIHVSPAFATFAANARLLEPDNGVLRTILGTPVVPGYGYVAGAHPAGLPAAGSATQEWIYATGPVEVRRSEVLVVPERIEQALDRSHNSLTYRIERYYVVDWDTAVQTAVLVDYCQSGCGSPA